MLETIAAIAIALLLMRLFVWTWRCIVRTLWVLAALVVTVFLWVFMPKIWRELSRGE